MATKSPIADFITAHPEVESISLKVIETCFNKVEDKGRSETREYSDSNYPLEIRPVFIFNREFHMMNTETSPIYYAMAAFNSGGAVKKKASLVGYPDDYLFYNREIICEVKTKMKEAKGEIPKSSTSAQKEPNSERSASP